MTRHAHRMSKKREAEWAHALDYSRIMSEVWGPLWFWACWP